jgi:CheY-like chemotaxis protein
MDPATLTIAALGFVGSCIARKCADASLEAAWVQIVSAFKRWRGTEPTTQTVEDLNTQQAIDPELLREAEAIFGRSSALRRARLVAEILRGASILWVDDRPENNMWERSLLHAFGIETLTAETTRSALACLERRRVDLVLSDIARENRPDEGVRAIPEIKSKAVDAAVILYVGSLSSSNPPRGAFGITNDPNELLHLILDSLERTRV